MQEIIVRDESEITNKDFYQSLLEDCQAIIVERGFRARMEVVEGKWDIGKRIYEENSQMNRQKIYGERIIENLSRDLGVSNSSLSACVQFFKKFEVDDFEEVISRLPGGKETSWTKIVYELLGGNKEKVIRGKRSYKLEDVCEVARVWLQDDMGITDQQEIEHSVNNLKELIIKYKVIT